MFFIRNHLDNFIHAMVIYSHSKIDDLSDEKKNKLMFNINYCKSMVDNLLEVVNETETLCKK